MRSAIVVGIIAVVVGAALVWGQNVETGPNPFIVLGLVNGAIFGLVALGLVLVYKGTRVFNFAQGEFGTIAAYFLFFSVDGTRGLGLPYGVGIVMALVGIVIVGLLMERLLIRPLLTAPRITVLVSTIAIALLAIGIEILVFRIDPLSLSTIIESESAPIILFGLPIDWQRLLAIGVLGGFGVMLAYFFSRTDLGLAVLATSQDSFATRVVGIGVERMSRFIWGSAALLGGVAGIIYVPLTGALLPGVMTSNILIPAFTGAVLGGMTSLPGAFVGGVVVGVVQSFSLWAVGHYHFGERAITEVIPGAEQVSVLLVMLAILLARPQGLLGKEA